MGIFADQQYRFHKMLRDNHIMIMSGYGWGDVPIDHQLSNWLRRNKDNKIILLHNNTDSLAEGSLILLGIYDRYKNENQILPIKK